MAIAIKRKRVLHFFWMLASSRFKQGCVLVDGDAIVVAFLGGGGVLIMRIEIWLTKLWDIVVCYMNGNAANFCGMILVFGRVVVTHVIMSMVIPI